MALYTKKLLMSTFQEMLEELPFDKITVAALVKRAGISPNTFYYHYQDIYALLDAWFRERAEAFIPSDAPIALMQHHQGGAASMQGASENSLSCVRRSFP